MAGRRKKKAPEKQTDIAMRAFDLKNSAAQPERPQSRTSRKGMKPLPNDRIAPEGALEAEGGRPALGRSRAR